MDPTEEAEEEALVKIAGGILAAVVSGITIVGSPLFSLVMHLHETTPET